MNCPVLSKRLLKVAELVPPCKVFLDVGTDHAYLPVYLLKNNICKKAIASDLRKGPLDSAAKTLENFGVLDFAELRLGSGFEAVEPKEVDAAVVAGMGGILISELIKASEPVVRQLKTLVLQPMTAVYELRKFLYENNFSIEKEFLAKEDEKLYHIMSVIPEKSVTLSEAELFMGTHLLEKSCPLCREYINKQIKKLKKQLDGLKKAKEPDFLLIKEREKLLSDILERTAEM